jgi:hypothetical protein
MMAVNSNTNNKGSAAKPFDKKNVAVFGGGGYLGGIIFGFLQRAGSLYGTGLASIGSPRCVVATGMSSMALNGILGKHFILAQADESFVKLTDTREQSTMEPKLKGMDAVILGTRYFLEQRPVTGNTYDITPNDKTTEFYLDLPRSSTVIGKDNAEFCWRLLEKSVQACRAAGVQHLVVVETDAVFVERGGTAIATEKYVELLEQVGLPFTYIRPLNKLENVADYTYAKGVQGDFKVQMVPDSDEAAKVVAATTTTTSSPIYREDLAALCVQCLLTLDWSSSRVLYVSSTGPVSLPTPDSKSVRPDRAWCVNSNILAEKLSAL